MFPTILNFKYFFYCLIFKTCIYHLFSMSVCVINHVISRLKNSNPLTKNLSKYDFPFKIEQEMIVYIFFSHRLYERKYLILECVQFTCTHTLNI